MSSAVSTGLRARVRAGIEQPVGRFFARLRLTPNALTMIGFAIAVVAACFAATQAWLFAGLLVAFGAVFDMFDGALARATGKVTRLGGFMDSTFDRAGEAVVYVGIAIGATGMPGIAQGIVVAAAAAMAAAFMVSYTRAKAESLGFSSGTGMASIGVAPREVRVVILTFGLLIAGNQRLEAVLPPGNACVDGCTSPGAWWLFVSLGLITLLAGVTTVQRIYHVYQQSKKEQ
jgi:phosphatidylglycerophosphate synthase